MRLNELLFENLNEEFNNNDELIDWLYNLNIPTKAPPSISKVDHKLLKDISDIVNSIKSMPISRFGNDNKDIKMFELLGKLNYLRLSKEEIETTYSNSKATTLDLQYGIYFKQDSTSYKTFETNAHIIDNFLSTLSEPHNRVITDKVKVKFVDANVLRSIAKYSNSEDILYVNPKKVGNTQEEYGSMLYVILHELGHRYLKQFPQSWDYDNQQWNTTKYSMSDSMTGEERFAELFALSHWKEKYSQYKNIIEKFLNILK